MQLPFPPARHPRAIVLVAATATLLAVAGCGGSDGGSAQATSPGTPVPTIDPAIRRPTLDPNGTSVPSTSIPQHVTPTGVPQGAQPKPPGDVSKENDLRPATAADKLIVKSGSGKKPVWRVAAQLQGQEIVCVAVTSLGVSTPTPDCETGTQLGLELYTSAGSGPGIANVAQIQRFARNPPSDVLVSGAALGDVRKVYVEYLNKKYEADLSKHTVSVPVKKANVETIVGAKAAGRVPSRIAVKVFGVTLPKINGNPPTSAQLKGRKPKNGAITFALS